MAVWATFLADASRLTGYPVNEVRDWHTHGHGGFRVIEGVVGHHTADGPTGDYPSLDIVRNGRAGLAGPLANLGLGRTGKIQVIAAGVAWHAGASRWAEFTDLNDEFLGIEAESTGTVDDWTPEQRDCYPRLVAALLYYIRRDATRFAGHREVALPAGRKVDPAFWDLAEFRRKVAWYLAAPLDRIPKFKGTAPSTSPSPVPRTTSAAPERRGGLVIPILLPRTPAPPATDTPSDKWPFTEEIVNLGWVGGWRGRCMVRLSFAHPGGRLFRAHFDHPEDGRAVVTSWAGVGDWPGLFCEPAYKAGIEYVCEAPNGPTSLMITYAAPGGASLSVEWER